MKRLVFPLLFVSLCIFCTASFAAVPLGGLAVAVSPNGRTIVAGGDNRVLYVLDADKLEVKNRIWLGVCLVDLHFNNDGSVLLAEDTDGTVLALNTVNWEIKKSVQKASQMSVAR